MKKLTLSLFIIVSIFGCSDPEFNKQRLKEKRQQEISLLTKYTPEIRRYSQSKYPGITITNMLVEAVHMDDTWIYVEGYTDKKERVKGTIACVDEPIQCYGSLSWDNIYSEVPRVVLENEKP